MPDGARVAETNKPRPTVSGRGSVATTDSGPVEGFGREGTSRPTGPAMDPRIVARLPAGQQVRLLQHMQRGYGNAQVSRMVSQLQTAPTPRSPNVREADPVLPANAPPQTASEVSAPAQLAVAAPAPLRRVEIHPSPSGESAGQSDQPGPDFGEGREEQPLQRLVEGVGAPAAPPNANGIVQRSSYVLNKAAEWAHDVPGYTLLTVILGKDPINDEAVPRTAVNFVHGVISLIPGGDAIFKNLQDSGALDQAFQWLNTETAKLGITWGAVKGAVQQVVDSVGLADLADPGAAWDRVKHIIMPLVDKVKQFAVDASKKLFEFVLEGALKMAGPLAGTIMAAIKKAGDVVNTIAKDPVAFLANLLRAVKGGFEQFMGNIETHLKQGLMGWLFGSLAGAGIELPKTFDLKGILSLVLQILGLSWQNLRTKLVGALGEPVVSAVEKTVGFVKTIASEGIAAAWQQIVQWITESIGSLKDMVLGAIKDWVVTTIIKQAVMKLVSMFNPVGAIIQAIITIYNTVQFVIDKAKQIADLANAVLDSIANIASGNIAAAANYVEQTLGKAVPVVIGFLADLIGLGGITDKIKEIIQKIRQPIDKVMGKMVGFVASKAKPIIDKMKAKGQAIVGAVKGKLGIGKEKDRSAGGAPEPASAGAGDVKFPEKTFAAGDEKHRVWVDTQRQPPELIVSSDPTPVEAFLNTAEASTRIPKDNKKRLPEARQTAIAMQALIKAIEQAKTQSPGLVQKMQNELQAKEDHLCEIISEILGDLPIERFNQKYSLEGLVTTYAAMPGQTGDEMTPDHQPQADLLLFAASLKIFKGRQIQDVVQGKHVDGGMTINLSQTRHVLGATFGRPANTSEVTAAIDPAKTADQQRTSVIGVLRNKLGEDVAAMLKVVNQPLEGRAWDDIRSLHIRRDDKDKLRERVKSQVEAGESRIQSQNLDRLKEPK